MSTSSSNMAVITESPKREMLRVSSMPGTLAMASSMGNVTSCSTSCPASVGQPVMICTWLLVMSGTASMGSFDALQTPHTISSRVIRPTMALFFILNFMIESNTFVLINANHFICPSPVRNGKTDHRQITCTQIEDMGQDFPDTENQLLSINLRRLPDVVNE